MGDIIQLLPDSVANQIAAGEVIQRPASVIKELVENSVDAGADDIRIYIRDAGRTLIQVIDNGSGMTDTDARMAFERHATSKIRNASDLFSLHTMGFRGEALPSICAISHVEVRSRKAGSTMGTKLIINGSRVESQTPDLCDEGTNIMVKDLFFNVPARRKFLKSDKVELSNIMREFERLALVNPGLKMSIDTGGKTVELRKGSFHQRISDLWKGSLGSQLIPVEAETPEVKISGFITRPEFARRHNPLQYFFVNGRNMRHPYFHKAVTNCFNGLLAPDTMPCYFIKFDVNPSKIDVNIHPTKNEIKFEEEMLIWSILSAAVKGSLGKYSAVPSIDFTAETLPVEPVKTTGTQELPRIEIPADYNPFADAVSRQSRPQQDNYRATNRVPRNWETLYEGFLENPTSGVQSDGSNGNFGTVFEPGQKAPELPIDTPLSSTPGISIQYANKYIISCDSRGMLIIDQHRAHVKILFERLIQCFERTNPLSQQLLFPEPLHLSPAQEDALNETKDILRQLGLKISGKDGEYEITGVPPEFEDKSPVGIIQNVLDSVMEDSVNYGNETPEAIRARLQTAVTLSMARSMAIRKGRKLNEEEMESILAELFSLPDPALTPSGRRVFAIMDEGAIRRLLP